MNLHTAGGHIVLVADDSEKDLQIFQRAWRMLDFGWSLSVLRGGTECVDYLTHKGGYSDLEASSQPTLLILDLSMPNTDGFEVLRVIKSLPILKRLPIIVFTDSRSEDDVARCYDLGANAYIIKPPGGAELLEALRKICEFWQLVALPDLTGGETSDDCSPVPPVANPAR